MYTIIDLETTWLSPLNDAIIEFACVKIDDNFQEIGRLHSFVNPKVPIPALISGITNIYDEDVENAPIFESVMDDIQDFIGTDTIVGHNIAFDLKFLDSHGVDVSKNPVVDTFFFANFLAFEEKSLNLWYLCEQFGIELLSAHRAIDDTLATAKLFKKLILKLQGLWEREKNIYMHFTSLIKDPGLSLIYEDFLKANGFSKQTSFDFPSQYLKSFSKFQEDIHEIYSSKKTLNALEILSWFSEFEARKSQKEMLDKVDNTLSWWKLSLIEAPTWIWKTFAYLIPSIIHSLRFSEPVHISTSTKALQDQIFYKDLAFLWENFPEDFSYAKLKWKRNYFSFQSFFDFIEDTTMSSTKELSFILKLTFWSLQTESWELDELDFYGEEYSFLSEVHAASPFVLDDNNIYKEYEFVYKARMKAKKSNIIVTNNHILLSDLKGEWWILGDVKNLVIDEAHSLEDVVSSSLKSSFSYDSLVKNLLKIEKKYIKNKIQSEKFPIFKDQLLYNFSEFVSLFESKIFKKFSQNTKYKTLLLHKKDIEESQIQLLSKKILDIISDFLEQESWELKRKKLIFLNEFQYLFSLQGMLSEVFTNPEKVEKICYISHDDNYGLQITSTILSPKDFLHTTLFSKLSSLVMTSATLDMGDNFWYIKTILGLDNFEILQLDSDFDYNKQALLFIPNDLGDIKFNIQEIHTFITWFLSRVWGNTMVLFTAFQMLRDTFSFLKTESNMQNINVFAQWVSGSKHKLVEAFKKQSNSSVILGTDSFWEWIDLPWEDLKYLLIHKTPFPVPTDPIFIARSKMFKNSFEQYALPKSILKLKQGFGRLIRNKTDTGIVVFLDNRIYSSTWGEKLFSAFPKNIKIRSGRASELLDILSKTGK